jgi:hypothetical protein
LTERELYAHPHYRSFCVVEIYQVLPAYGSNLIHIIV